MKAAALLIMLALHVTGLWSHIPATTKASLVARASNTAPVRDPITAPATPSTPMTPTALPVRMLSTTPPTLSATAAIAVDRDTASILYAKNTGACLPIASVTKIVTTLVILSRHNVKDTVTIPTLPDYPVAAETIGLIPGDSYSLEDVLEAALVPSANDAADSLAIWDAGSITKFAARMNAKMSEWGISGTRFASASGLQDTGNCASAAALAKIATLALHNPDFARITQYQNVSFTSSQGRSFNLKTTNDLLASGHFYGIKTGYTQAAGECFVGLARINDHDVVTVVLGADDRFGSTTSLTNWINRAYQWL